MKKFLLFSLLILSAAFCLNTVSAEKKQPKQAKEQPEATPNLQIEGVPPEKVAEFVKKLEAIKKLEAELKFQQGVVTVGKGLAKLTLPETFKYLDPDNAQKVIVDIWGNPPREKSLGMIVPAEFTVIGEKSWGVIITYDEDGYVKDDDAASINYTDLLKQMQDGTREANEERKKNGYESIELIGWAESPHYDRTAHKLYWAKELKFGDGEEHTLNYDIRALGRRGVLSLNAVATMEQLNEIKKDMQSVLGFVEFNEGHRYTDYVAGTDKLAAYGIAALIAGKVAAKAGLFKLLLGVLIAGKKFLVVAVLAVVAFLRKLFGRKSDASEGSLSITDSAGNSENQAQ